MNFLLLTDKVLDFALFTVHIVPDISNILFEVVNLVSCTHENIIT